MNGKFLAEDFGGITETVTIEEIRDVLPDVQYSTLLDDLKVLTESLILVNTPSSPAYLLKVLLGIVKSDLWMSGVWRLVGDMGLLGTPLVVARRDCR